MSAPSQSMSLSQSQRLQMVLAPQLRQSLEMLQLPILELRTLIQQEMELNPTIEDGLTQAEPLEVEPGATQPEGDKPEEKKELDFKDEIEALSKLDDEWRDYFLQDRQVSCLVQVPGRSWIGHHLREVAETIGNKHAAMERGVVSSVCTLRRAGK